MAQVYNPEQSEKKLAQVIEETQPKTVCLIFIHGLGDLIMFISPYYALKMRFPDISFRIGLQPGLSFEDVVPDADFDICRDLGKLSESGYDLVALVHFPMSEGQQEFTKGEWCCIHELGIDPVCGHSALPVGKNRLIGVHFNITCLPDSCNPDRETAEKIWNEILGSGFIPIETHFQHVFHNPVNEKFDFVDCSVRRCKPQISSLTSLIGSLAGFCGVVSGNFHTALAILPSSRVFLGEALPA